MEALVYPRGPGGTDGGVIVGKPGEYALVRLADGQIGYAIANSPIDTVLVTAANAPEHTWTHVAVAYRNGAPGQVEVYENGVLVQLFPSAGIIGDNQVGIDELQIGDGQDPGRDFDQSFHGVIDEVRVWNVGRTGAQIAQNSARVLPESDRAGLAGYWRLDETDGLLALDSSPAAHATGFGPGAAMPGRAYGPNLPGYPLQVPEPGAGASALALMLTLAGLARSARRPRG